VDETAQQVFPVPQILLSVDNCLVPRRRLFLDAPCGARAARYASKLHLFVLPAKEKAALRSVLPSTIGFPKVPRNPGVYFPAFANIELELDELVVSSLLPHQKTP
jgi:hypothetical protein